MSHEPPVLLWTVEDYLERSRSPHPSVRAWAMQRLQSQHPLLALARAAEALGEDDDGAHYDAIEILRRWGDASYSDTILAGLATATGRELARRARLLADWGCEAAVGPLAARVGASITDPMALDGLCAALGRLAPARLSPWTKQQIGKHAEDIIVPRMLVGGLAECHLATDIGWMVDRWLEDSQGSELRNWLLDALHDAVGPAWLAQVLPEAKSQGAAAVAERIEEEEHVRLPLSESALVEVLRAARSGESGWPATLLAAVRSLIEERQLPIEA